MSSSNDNRIKKDPVVMPKGGVIMDVINGEQAKLAEAAGAVAVMDLERVPSDIRAAGGVARMANPYITDDVLKAVSLPVLVISINVHIITAHVLVNVICEYIFV